MKPNYDRSKTIRKTTTNLKNYHLLADDLLLLIICRPYQYWGFKKRMKSHRLPGYNCTLKIYPGRLVYNFGSLKIVKLAFHWRWIFAFVSLRPWLHYLNITQMVFCCDRLFILFSLKLKTQNFQGDALLVRELHSFIDFSQYPSQTSSPCPHPTPQLPWHCNFSPGFRWSPGCGV